MKRYQKSMLSLLGILAFLLLSSSVVYMLGMEYLEGRPRSFWSAFEWASETLSTTGYGADHSWTHPLMVIFVGLVQFLGVFFVFLIFPIYLIPMLEERFETRLPVEATKLQDHILIYRFGPAVATLLEELEGAEVRVVVVEEEESLSRRLIEAKHEVVFGKLDEGVLEKVGLLKARSLIVNSSDEQNAAAIIAARQLGFEGEILALVEDPLHYHPMLLAGATAAYTPRYILGAALASRASRKVSPMVSGIQNLGNKLQVSEARINKDSSIVGKTLAEAKIGAETGVTVIGQWIGGKLVTPPTSGMVLEAGGILVLVGSVENVERFAERCSGTMNLRQRGHFVVAGYGEAGRKVVELLKDAGEETRVIAMEASDGVDIVGNVLDPRVLESADIEKAQAIVVALSEDSATTFATVIVKDMAPSVPVIARVNRVENIERIYGAGADFALSISQVSGQILAWRLLKKQAIAVDGELKVFSAGAGHSLSGRNPAQLKIRERTACSVVGVERKEELLMEIGPSFVFEAEDTIYLCGSAEGARRFRDEFEA